MRKSLGILPFGLLTGLLFSGCGQELPLGFLDYPIINGETDRTIEHMAVVVVSSSQGGTCSGTLIAPRVILTAAHCAEAPTDTYSVLFGYNMNNYTSREVSEKWVHPYYSSYQLVNDIALMRLSSSEPSSATPIPHLPYSERVTQSDIYNDTPFTFVGFGVTDPDDEMSFGVKMKFTDGIDWICESSNCPWSNPGHENTICQNQSPSGLCQGDSGGPAFVTRGGQEYVAGIASYVGQDCEQFGCSTKVDAFEGDIEDFLGGVLGSTCTSAAECDSGYCVDGVCCESSCSSICDACNLSGYLGECRTLHDGALCNDDNKCNGIETCQGGICTPGNHLQCANSNKCTGDTCDPAVGCLYEPMPNGTSCSNGDICDGEEICQDGICTAGEPVVCDDRNPCTDDICDSEYGGCTYVNVADNTSCGGGVCGEQYCQGGVCVSSNTETCNDGDPCTRDWCNPDTGCVNSAQPDGYACGECMMCWQGDCVEAPDCGGSGCGCSSTANPAGGLFLLLLVLLSSFTGRRRWSARS